MSVELTTVKARAACDCGATVGIELMDAPYNTIGDIDRLSGQIGMSLEDEGWSDDGTCPECVDAARKEAASE